MSTLEKLKNLYSELNKVHKKKSFGDNYDLVIKQYDEQINRIQEADYKLYDFYHSYKHYNDLRQTTENHILYIEINPKYCPIITDVVPTGQTPSNDQYCDLIFITTSRLSKLKLQCSDTNLISFPLSVMRSLKGYKNDSYFL